MSSSPYSERDIAFPSFVAGELGTDAEAWRMTTSSSSSTSVATRRAIIDQAIREAEEQSESKQAFSSSISSTTHASEPRTRATPQRPSSSSSTLDPLLDPQYDSLLRTEALVSASLAQGEETVGGVRLLKMENDELHRVLKRKEDQLARFESELKDLTHIIEQQGRQREHQLEVQKQWNVRERNYAQSLDSLKYDRDQHSSARERFEQELAHERSEHAKTKQHMQRLMDAQESKLQMLRSELEVKEAEREQQATKYTETLSELEIRCDAVSTSEAQSQERLHSTESQLRQSNKLLTELESKLRHTLDDAEYLSQELASMKAQLSGREEQLRTTELARRKQASAVEDLSKELSQLHVECTQLQKEISTRPTAQAFEHLQQRYDAEKQSSTRLEHENDGLKKKILAAENDVARLEGRAKHQEDHLSTLQTKHADLLVQSVAFADTKNQLQAALFEGEQMKNQLRAYVEASKEARVERNKMEVELKDLQSEKAVLVSDQSRFEETLRQRNRTIRMLGDQVRTMVEKNPFNQKLNLTAAPTASGAAAERKAEEDPDLSPVLPVEQEFLLLRDQVNALLLTLHTRNRQAYSVFLDQEQSLSLAQDELAAVKKTSQSKEREWVEKQAEQTEALQALEQKFFQQGQELLVAKTDAQEHASSSSKHRAQLKSIWAACLLLYRTLVPLQNRYNDLVAQKRLVQTEEERMKDLAREVIELRKGLEAVENAAKEAERKDADTASSPPPESTALILATASSAHSIASRHPYLLRPPPRISLRSAVIAVLAARRLWQISEGKYGVVVGVAGERVVVMKESENAGIEASFASSQSSSSRTSAPLLPSLPPLDSSTVGRSASSLVGLMEHMEQHIVNPATSRWLSREDAQERYHRSTGSGGRTLMQGLIEGQRAWNVRMRALVAASTASSEPATSHEDLTRIRSIAIHLATSNRDLRSQWQTAQLEYVRLVHQSNRTEEALQHEQQKALDQLRLHAEASRHAEESSTELINALRSQLASSEHERSRLITREEYQELANTSEMVLAQCRDLERANEQLQLALSASKDRESRSDTQLKIFQEETSHLRKVVEEKTKSWGERDRGLQAELQETQLQMRKMQAAAQERELELSEVTQEFLKSVEQSLRDCRFSH